ncbi:MAG: efflux transporter periplasmic adaptor subunit [Fluviicola sp.]|nr:MAG: efflux transporter periplasmic adaptor subunit [Fluviicola sp.]
MKYKKSFLLLFLAINMVGCQGARDEAVNESAEVVTLSHTIWTDKTELFVEFKPLVVGQNTRFAAHFSEMEQFKAITEGKVTVSLIKNKTGIRQTVDAPDSPGIFKPSITPKTTGIYTLVFEITTPTLTDRIQIENVVVYANTNEVLKNVHPEKEDPNAITFLKEQAWKMEFANAPVVRGTVYDIIKTGGKILPSQGDEKTIIATTSGIVIYASTRSMVGTEVSKGQTLFTITGGNLTNNNVETRFIQSKSNYTREKSNFERKGQLFESKAISKSEYEEAQRMYQLAESEYNNLASNFGGKGKIIKASSAGFIKTLFKGEGEYVEAGEALAVITQNKRLTIQADVSQLDYHRINESSSANFSFNGKAYSLADFNGKLLSYGKSVSVENPKIPVYFELDNTGNLLSGSFIDVWIKTNPSSATLKIPVLAVMEEYGAFSAYVQVSGESFEKRELELGVSDGIYVEVISGVKEGERVVTFGAYQVKMASMSGQVPAHGHSH